MFYDRFIELCQHRGITPTQAARESGIPQSTASMWKTQKTTPNATTAAKLAAYFGVTVDYLLTGHEAGTLGNLISSHTVEAAAAEGLRKGIHVEDGPGNGSDEEKKYFSTNVDYLDLSDLLAKIEKGDGTVTLDGQKLDTFQAKYVLKTLKAVLEFVEHEKNKESEASPNSDAEREVKP